MAVKEWFNAWNYIRKYKTFGWFLFWGQRSNGKTFSVIDGCMRAGLRIAYIRRYDTEIENADMIDLFNGDHNINQITNEEYNNVCIKSGKKLYYCNYDENGKISEISDRDIAQCFSINRWEKYKGADRGQFDVIIFDEFMSENELPDEYIKFKNMLSTLLRNRDNSIIVMLANSFNPFSIYFDELQVNEIVQGMKRSETKTVDRNGTKILLHWCKKSDVTKKVNNKFFGFDLGKERYTMIEGGNWQIKDYPHCTVPYINKPINSGGNVIAYMYILFRSKIMRVAVINSILVPPFIHCYFVNELPEKATAIFTPNTDIQTNVTYLNIRQWVMSNGKRGKLFQELLDSNRIYFNTNLEGEFFKTWYNVQNFSKFGW